MYLQVINYYAGGHVDLMQVGELLDLHQHISFPVFSPSPSRIPNSDLRIKQILYITLNFLQVKILTFYIFEWQKNKNWILSQPSTKCSECFRIHEIIQVKNILIYLYISSLSIFLPNKNGRNQKLINQNTQIQSALKGCINFQDGVTLFSCNTLAFDFTELTHLYFLCSHRHCILVMYISELKKNLLKALVFKQLVKFSSIFV